MTSYFQMNLRVFLTIILILGVNVIFSQNTIEGIVKNIETKEFVAYTNIFVKDKNTATISNENGEFVLQTNVLSPNDIVVFENIGYGKKEISIKELRGNTTVLLKEEIFNLVEVFKFANPPSAKSIVKKVIQNKHKNHKTSANKSQVFIRWRDISDIRKADIKIKKNSIKELSEYSIKKAMKKLKYHNVYYTDFLGDIYFSSRERDSIKINSTKVVSLKQNKASEIEKIDEIFEKLFANTNKKEYWKIKTGIISSNITVENNKDSLDNSSKNNDFSKTKYYAKDIQKALNYTLLNDKKRWEFLYKTGRYNYSIVGGARINNEDVYVIEFSPRKSGKYIGKVYISIETNALVKADYAYAKGKTGRNINLFGISYKEYKFDASIFFEKKKNNYNLKYFSVKKANNFGVKRDVSLIKKRKRLLFDKKLKQIKASVDYNLDSEISVEFLVLNKAKTSQYKYNNFRQKKKMKIIYTDYFDENLWKGYPSIEPIKKMKEYRK